MAKNDQHAFQVVDKEGSVIFSNPIGGITSGGVEAETSVPLSIDTVPATVRKTGLHRTSHRTSNSVISGDFLGDYTNAPSPVSDDLVT